MLYALHGIMGTEESVNQMTEQEKLPNLSSGEEIN
jgi:hypothetical protein